MIDEQLIDPLLAAVRDLPSSGRMAVFRCLTLVPLSDSAWRKVEAMALGLSAEFILSKLPLPGWADTLLSTPLASVRDQLLAFAKTSANRNSQDVDVATLRQAEAAAKHEPEAQANQAVLAGDHRELVKRLVSSAWSGFKLDVSETERLQLSRLPLEEAATLFESAVHQLANLVGDAGAVACDVHNALIELAATLPASLPISAPHVLEEPGASELLPRDALCWAVARAGGPHAIELLLENMSMSDPRGRTVWIEWLVDLGAHIGRPVPDATNLQLRRGVPVRRGTGMPTDGKVRGWRGLPEESPSLHFVLRGKGALGDTLVAGSSAELVLQENAAPADSLLRLADPAIDSARNNDLDILLLATARGAVTVTGAQFKTARFRAGRMAEPVRFEVSAGPAGPAEGSLHIEFLVKGESVYQTRVPIHVIAADTAAASSAPTKPLAALPGDLLERAVSSVRPPDQQIVLSLSVSGGRFRIALADLRNGQTEFSDEFEADDGVDRARLEAMLKGIDVDLKTCYADEDVWGVFDGEPAMATGDQVVVDALRRTTETVVAAGSRLYDDLRESPRIRVALEYIENNARPGAVLSITTDNIFLPWEILYPYGWPSNPSEEFRRGHAVQPEAFWGVRFAIETERRGMGSMLELRRKHRASPPKVALNLNPSIKLPRASAEKQPLMVQGVWAQQLEGDGKLDGVRQSCQEMRSVLQDGAGDATLIYIYCHGSSPNPFIGTGEELLLGAECRLKPRDLQGGPPYKNAPIIFLNSCRGAVSSPLAFSSFLTEFRKRGALGMVATSYATPIAYAARFAREVVECCLRRSESLAIEMLDLRRRHLLERGDPVPLFYTLQCHLHAINCQ